MGPCNLQTWEKISEGEDQVWPGGQGGDSQVEPLERVGPKTQAAPGGRETSGRLAGDQHVHQEQNVKYTK